MGANLFAIWYGGCVSSTQALGSVGLLGSISRGTIVPLK